MATTAGISKALSRLVCKLPGQFQPGRFLKVSGASSIHPPLCTASVVLLQKEHSDSAYFLIARKMSSSPAPVPLESVMKTVEDAEIKADDKSETTSTNGANNAASDESQPKKEFLRKKKTVLMMSYCGQNYLGMQKNPGMKTIEEDLLFALLKANYIDEEAYKTPRVMQFQRAARTDKHVSAARQIVSLKMPDTVDIEKINTFLPPEIRVMGVRKVTKGFDSKQNCDARTYMYMIPTFAFTPLELPILEDYRISPEVLESLREILKIYLGTKNFHNFTSRRKPTDPSSRRYIISFTASDPFVKDGLEYVILRVKGQSFMLHQIRKMIGLVVAYMRGLAGKETFEKSWSLERVDIPKAPGLGLMLGEVHYDRYDKRYGKDGIHEPLSWEGEREKVERFCDEFIYPIVTREENESKSMFKWLETLAYHTYDIREQIPNELLEKDADGVVINRPRSWSKIGEAAVLVGKTNREEEDSSDGEEEDDDDQVKIKDTLGKRGARTDIDKAEAAQEKEKVGEPVDEDEEDNAFVQAELAKRRKMS